jgi:hypothetical protein
MKGVPGLIILGLPDPKNGSQKTIRSVPRKRVPASLRSFSRAARRYQDRELVYVTRPQESLHAVGQRVVHLLIVQHVTRLIMAHGRRVKEMPDRVLLVLIDCNDV